MTRILFVMLPTLGFLGCPDSPDPAAATPVDGSSLELQSDSGGDRDSGDGLLTGDGLDDAQVDTEAPEVVSDTSTEDLVEDTAQADAIDTSSTDAAAGDATVLDAPTDGPNPDTEPSDTPVGGDGAGAETSPSDAAGEDGGIADSGAGDAGDGGGGPNSGALGAPCSSGADCDSGYCFQPLSFGGSVCSACSALAGCNLGSVCTYSDELGYAQCTGFGPLGTSCSDGGGCASGFCNNQLCSECETDQHCDGGSCVESAPGAYYECQGGLGDDCVTNTDCAAGYCYGGPDGDVCSECVTDADCGTGEACLYDADNFLNNGAGYAICEPVDQLGDPCTADGDCASGFCYTPAGFGSPACSECKADTDCPTSNFTCDYSLLVGYAECNGSAGNGAACTLDAECADGSCAGGSCLGALGSACTTGSMCASGFCGDNLTQFQPSVCSECEQDSDCNGGACNFSFLEGYRVCQ